MSGRRFVILTLCAALPFVAVGEFFLGNLFYMTIVCVLINLLDYSFFVLMKVIVMRICYYFCSLVNYTMKLKEYRCAMFPL